MKVLKRKLLSLILAAAMVVSLLPTAALAGEAAPPTDGVATEQTTPVVTPGEDEGTDVVTPGEDVDGQDPTPVREEPTEEPDGGARRGHHACGGYCFVLRHDHYVRRHLYR